MGNYVADYHELLRRDDVEAVLILVPIPLNLPITATAWGPGNTSSAKSPLEAT